MTKHPKKDFHKTANATPTSPVSAPTKRKRNLPSQESCPKISRQQSPERTDKNHNNNAAKVPLVCESSEALSQIRPSGSPRRTKRNKSKKTPLVFESSEALSPIRPEGSQSGTGASGRSQLMRKTCDGDESILHSTPVVEDSQKLPVNALDSASGADRSATSTGKQEISKAESSVQKSGSGESQDRLQPDDKSGPDLFAEDQRVDSPVFVEVQVDEAVSPSNSDEREDGEEKDSVEIIDIQSKELTRQSNSCRTEGSVCSTGEKQIKIVHFKDFIKDADDFEDHDGQDSNLTHPKTTKKSQKHRSKNVSDNTVDKDESVEILNTSTGFEPAEFYPSPTSQGAPGAKRKCLLANLKSPQLVSSIPTPVNSLPSHQPRRSLVPSGSQSSVNNSNQTNQTFEVNITSFSSF